MFRVIVLLSCLLPLAASGQLRPESLIAVRQLQDPRPNADGSIVAFSVVEPPKGASSARNIWAYEMAAGKVRQLTSTGSDSSPRWSPDGKRLAFQSSRSGSPQIWAMPASGGDPVQISNHAGGIRSFDWSPDGRQIAFLAGASGGQQKGGRGTSDARVIRSIGGGGSSNALWVLDLASSQERQISAANFDISAYVWRPDGSGLVVTATDHPELEQFTLRIFRVPVNGGSMVELINPKGPIGQLKCSPDGSKLAFVGAREGGPVTHDLYLIPLEGGKAVNVTAKTLDRPISQFDWRDHATIEALVETGFDTQLYTIPVSGNPARVPDVPGPVAAFSRLVGNGFAFIHESSSELPELWIAKSGSPARAVTALNESWRSVALAKPEFFRYTSADGVEVEAAALRPAGSGNARVPTIFLFHGGPIGRWSDRFDALGQLLVSHGYAVVYPNIRGATGYGHRMIERILPESRGGAGWAAGPFKDAMGAVDAAIRRGIADPDRLAIGGWSYGGYMAAWAITHTNRFKVAVAGAGVYDLFNDLATETASYVPGDIWNFGPFFEDSTRPELQKQSPIAYVKNARTPVLLLHGEQDPVDTIGQAYAFYRALKYYGSTVEFVVYPREGHSLREDQHQIDRLSRSVEWIDRYMKNGISKTASNAAQ